MIRKKAVEHLQPLKITKTQANYQALLLDMMSKLVHEQRESNRLLRKLTGENDDNDKSSLSIHTSPRKPIFQSLQKSLPIERNFIKKQMQTQENGSIDDLSIRAPSNNQSISMVDNLDRRSLSGMGPQEIVKSIEGLGQVMKNLESTISNKLDSLQQEVKLQRMQRTEYRMRTEKSNISKDSHDHHKKDKSEHHIKEENHRKEDNFMKNGFNFGVQDEKLDAKIDVNKKPKVVNKKKGAHRLSAFDTIKIEKKLQLAFAQCKPILSLNKQIHDKKNYSIVTQFLPISDKRELKMLIPFEQIMEYYQIKKISDEREISILVRHWLGDVYKTTASICWNLLSNDDLTFQESKILFTENIIYNFIEFMRGIKILEANSKGAVNRCKIVEEINETSVNILDFLCKQYPQTRVEDPNIALRNQIPSIDNKGEAEYDLISKVSQAKVVNFRKKDNGDYTQQIMKTINYMIERSNEEYDQFKDIFTNIFGEIFIPLHKRKDIIKDPQSNESQMYYQKIKSFTKFSIGRKISKNTPKYSEAQIQNGIFFVKSPSILRVITKWVEQLDQIVRNPEQMIKNTPNQFKDHNGLSIYLYTQIKHGLYKAIKDRQQFFQNKVKHIKQQCYHMEVLLTLQMFTTNQNLYEISQDQISVASYCHYFKKAISSYICSELNEVIHFLLNIPSTVDETKIGISDPFYQQESKKDLLNVNLISFKLFDLLRCKCISKESQIVYLMKRLNQKNNDPSDPFKIIRTKDRLSHGTRDILINAQIAKGLVCEIQLAVISNIDKKQELLDQYNHFLYELKRAKLGPLSENAAIWSNLQQKAGFFDSLIVKQERQVKHGQVDHKCVSSMETSQTHSVRKFTRPIICVSCNRFYEMPRTCLFNISCDRCKQTFCGECHFIHMSLNQRKQELFEKHFRPFFPYLTEYQSYDKPIPKFGFLFKKYHLKKQLFFFRILAKNNNQLSQKGKIDIEVVISVIQKNRISNRTINQCPLQAEQKNGQFYLKDKKYRQQFSNFIIYSIDTTRQLEKKTLPFQQIFENFQKQKLKYLNLLKQPAYVEDLRVIKRSKQIKRQSKELRALFGGESLEIVFTYLRLDKLVILAQIEMDENLLNAQLIKHINIMKLKNFAIEKSFAVSMDFRQMTNQMELINNQKMKYFSKQLYDSFSKRVRKLFVNFGFIKQITSFGTLTNLRVLYMSANVIQSLSGVETLSLLQFICFDKNRISSLQPLSKLTNLVQISGSENEITSLNGLQNLSKVVVLTLYKNNITEINCLQNIKLKELSLNYNPISSIDSIIHMKDTLEQLYIGGTKIQNLSVIQNFTFIKKLSLDGLKLKKIDLQLIKALQLITYLSLADNEIEKIENLQGEIAVQLVQLNLRNNRLTQISGLETCGKIQILKLQRNFITNISGLKGLDHLKSLDVQENPLQDCSGLYHVDNNFQFFYSKIEDNVDPLYAPKQQFYEKYQQYLKHRGMSSSGSNQDSEIEDD